MKITPEHYNKLDSLMKVKLGEIDAALRNPKEPSPENPYGNVIDFYETGRIPRADKVKDLQTRFCFDFFAYGTDSEFKSELYQYLNDDHIETALRRIMPKVTKRY